MERVVIWDEGIASIDKLDRKIEELEKLRERKAEELRSALDKMGVDEANAILYSEDKFERNDSTEKDAVWDEGITSIEEIDRKTEELEKLREKKAEELRSTLDKMGVDEANAILYSEKESRNNLDNKLSEKYAFTPCGLWRQK